MSRGRHHVRRMRFLVLAPVGVLAACVDSSSISVEEEREMGLVVAEQAAREMPLLQDEPVVRFVRELGGHIVQRADTTGREYQFHVVDSEMTNAFAIPGGFIFLHRGILERAESASELAGVLAHEIGHVVERHGLEQMAKARNTNTAVGLIYVLLGRAPGAAEQVALQVAGSAWMAKHSREAEREAGPRGRAVPRARGSRPAPACRSSSSVSSTRNAPNPNELLAWFSTHPLTQDRIAETEAMIARLPSDAVDRAARDLPQFAQMRRRLEGLPAPPPGPRALP